MGDRVTVLVDTSVWIDHLHQPVPRLVTALECDEVGWHPLVIEELEKNGVDVKHVQVMSGFRTPQYNENGGEKGGRSQLSRHMYGDAADIRSDDLTPRELYDIAVTVIGGTSVAGGRAEAHVIGSLGELQIAELPARDTPFAGG